MAIASALIPKNSKDIEGIRNFLTIQRAQACSTAAAYSGPIKELFDELVKKLDGWIKQLPTTDVPGDWSVENQLDYLFSTLAQASANASVIALELSKLKNGEQFATSLTQEINKRVTEGTLFTKEGAQAFAENLVKSKTEAGELVPKNTLTQLCSEAQIKGFGEGEAKVREELAAERTLTETINKRKALLQEAGLPLPEAELEKAILGGTDEEFAARKATFETRREDLKKEGIQFNSDPVLANLWLDEKAYGGFAKTVKNLPQLKLAPNPLARTPERAPENTKDIPILIV
jgi:hypothetical protein